MSVAAPRFGGLALRCLLIAVGLFAIAVVFSISSFTVEGAHARAVLALLLSLVSLAPVVIIALAVIESRL